MKFHNLLRTGLLAIALALEAVCVLDAFGQSSSEPGSAALSFTNTSVLAFSADDRDVWVMQQELKGVVQRVEIATGRIKQSVITPIDPTKPHSLSVSPDGNYVVYAVPADPIIFYQWNLYVHSLQSGISRRFTQITNWVQPIVFSQDSKRFAAAEIPYPDEAVTTPVHIVSLEDESMMNVTILGQTLSMAFSPAGRFLAIAHNGYQTELNITVADLANPGRVIQANSGRGGPSYAVAFLNEFELLASQS